MHPAHRMAMHRSKSAKVQTGEFRFSDWKQLRREAYARNGGDAALAAALDDEDDD